MFKKIGGVIGRTAYYGTAGLVCASILSGAYLHFMTDTGFVRWAMAQGFSIPDSSSWIGKMFARLGPGTLTPTITGGTLALGSTDSWGQITATSSGTIVLTFGSTWGAAPQCRVQNKSVSSIGVTWTEAATTLTINGSGYTAASVLVYACVGVGI